MWMLTSALRWNAGNGSLKDFQQCLLYTFTRYITRNRWIFRLSRNFINFINIDNSFFRTFYIVISCLNQFKQDVLDVLTNVTGLGQGRGVGDGKRHVQHLCQRLGQQRFAGAGGAEHQDVGLLQLDVAVLAGENALIVVVDRDCQHLFGGILADDMGLGKTLQTLAHILVEQEAGRLDRPALVVAPTSLMFNWRNEARRFAPSLKTLLLHGPQRRGQFQWIEDADLVLTTYPLLVRDLEWLKHERWHLLILDEAQAIKNARTRASRAVRQLQAHHRLCLTGTPLENNLSELWSQFDFLMPGLLGSDPEFRSHFRQPIEQAGNPERRSQLERRIRPFFLRRSKAEVAPELPPKTEIVRSVPLAGAQSRLYEAMREQMQERVRQSLHRDGPERGRIVVLDALLKLRQICCDPRLLEPHAASGRGASAKLELLMDLVPEMVREGRRILLFSQFVRMLEIIEHELAQRGIALLKLTGQTRDRQAVVEAFQSGRAPVFLISLRAGGVGLNLTAADTVIHYDPWWNPAVEDQATDRAHRIGQDQKVFVYRLLTEGTIEDKIQQLQASKRALIEGLLGGGGAVDLAPEDLAELFAPV